MEVLKDVYHKESEAYDNRNPSLHINAFIVDPNEEINEKTDEVVIDGTPSNM